MKTSRILLVAFAIVSIVQLTVPARMILNYEHILDSGKEYRFKIAPVDPSDPLRGKFIRVMVDENEIQVDSVNDWKFNESVYVNLTTDTVSGFAHVKGIEQGKPLGTSDFIQAKLGYVSGTILPIQFPFDRYYLDEWTAPQIDRIYREALRDTSKVSFVTVRVVDGEAVLKDLVINGKSVTKICAER